MNKTNFIPVSIIIPVSKDKKIFKCIESIDVKTEIIVILNGKYDINIENELRKITDIKIYKLKDFNFSKIYNFGIRQASYENIFFMDSDCVFDKGTLIKLYNSLDNYSITKGGVVFSYNNFIQKLIAKAREFTTSDEPNLYIPGPMFKKEIFKKIGLFNEEIYFSSDAEMNARIKKEKIKWIYIPEAKIIHAPFTIRQDFVSAFRYGWGRSQKHRVLNTKRSKSFIEEFCFYFIQGAKHKGLLVGIYLLFWWFCFNLGFFTEKIINKLKK
jgi:glycosyltransferase involved in cell wall biosynthesis